MYRFGELSLFLAVAVLLISSQSIEMQQSLMIHDLSRSDNISSVGCLSQTNQNIAFQSYRNNTSSICLISSDGTNLRCLTDHKGNDAQPAWSPDGKMIAFTSDRDYQGDFYVATTEIYIMDANGNNQRRLTWNKANDFDPAWSPDGEFIAFASDRDGDFEIYIMKTDGSNVHPLTANEAMDRWPAWSPDGKMIAFTSDREGNEEIFVMKLGESQAQRITIRPDFIDREPSWSPDGKMIAFESTNDGLGYYYNIYTMKHDGSDIQSLIIGSYIHLSPEWSPDGKTIVFASSRTGRLEIYALEVDGPNIQQLTYDGGTEPTWQPPLCGSWP
jgi:TolB protein